MKKSEEGCIVCIRERRMNEVGRFVLRGRRVYIGGS